MNNRFSFHPHPGGKSSTEANIFIHGYSAGHNEESREVLQSSIPESTYNCINIFAFWPSGHFTHPNDSSFQLLRASAKLHWATVPAVFVGDRAAHFWKVRSRAESMGKVLFSQLDEYLRKHHPKVEVVNLIGHSLGGRLIVSSLKGLQETSTRQSFVINNVLLMAAAVEVGSDEAHRMGEFVQGRLINAYSKDDKILLMNMGETCIGRNPVEHFDNIEMSGFGHSDYWKNLSEVLVRVEFNRLLKSKPYGKVSRPDPDLCAPTPLDDKNIDFGLDGCREIYNKVNDVLGGVVNSLYGDGEFDSSSMQDEVRSFLVQHTKDAQQKILEIEKSSEWELFTIAMYGETGTGKSTIVETLRILLQEQSKVVSQKKFCDLKDNLDFSEEDLAESQKNTGSQNFPKIKRGHYSEFSGSLNEAQYHGNKGFFSDDKERNEIQKRAGFLWSKLLNLPKAGLEKAKLVRLRKKAAAGSCELSESFLDINVISEKIDNEKNSDFHEVEGRLDCLREFSDGSIISDGNSDFTKKVSRYDLELGGIKFALLDVPGIEGLDDHALHEVGHAVQKSHLLLYVTNRTAPPQSGDSQCQDAFGQIKYHLAAKTEIWTLYNKKITNPIALTVQPLVSDDELEKLAGFNEKMRENLGSHYRGGFSISALPAFLASTDNFVPESQNARRRKKFLSCFDSDELLEISGMQALIRLLDEHFLKNCEARVVTANCNQLKQIVDQSNEKLRGIHKAFTELADKLVSDGESSCRQIQYGFSMLRQRLDALNRKLTDELISVVRCSVYQQVEQKISNEAFKDTLHWNIEQQQQYFNEMLPQAITHEVKIFHTDVEDIIKRFEEYSRELSSTYGKLGSVGLNSNFEARIQLDKGINVWGILGGVAGITAAIFTAGTSLWLTGAAVMSTLAGVGKTLWSAVSISYRQSQQRKATDDSLHDLGEKLKAAVNVSLDEVLEDMQKTIGQIEQALRAPGQQATDKAEPLGNAIGKLELLSYQISKAGNLP